MRSLPRTSISEHFATLADPRAERGKEHLLVDILTIALCAVICGADDWVGVATFGETKESWPRTFLALQKGIPSHTIPGLMAGTQPGMASDCIPALVQLRSSW